MSETTDRIFILYDGRACGGLGTDDATVLAVGDKRQVRAEAYMHGGGAIYSYAKDGKTLTDEKFECDVMTEESTP